MLPKAWLVAALVLARIGFADAGVLVLGDCSLSSTPGVLELNTSCPIHGDVQGSALEARIASLEVENAAQREAIRALQVRCGGRSSEAVHLCSRHSVCLSVTVTPWTCPTPRSAASFAAVSAHGPWSSAARLHVRFQPCQCCGGEHNWWRAVLCWIRFEQRLANGLENGRAGQPSNLQRLQWAQWVRVYVGRSQLRYGQFFQYDQCARAPLSTALTH